MSLLKTQDKWSQSHLEFNINKDTITIRSNYIIFKKQSHIIRLKEIQNSNSVKFTFGDLISENTSNPWPKQSNEYCQLSDVRRTLRKRILLYLRKEVVKLFIFNSDSGYTLKAAVNRLTEISVVDIRQTKQWWI